MKKLSILLFLLIAFVFARAQNPIPTDSNFAITQSVGNAPTTKVLTNALQVKKGFINAVYSDTTQANLPSSTVGGYRIKYFRAHKYSQQAIRPYGLEIHLLRNGYVKSTARI